MRDDLALRVITVLKMVLPLSALVMLSLVFLLARSIDPSRALPLASIDVEDLARDPRVSSATYAGETRDGAALSVAAEVVRADLDAIMRLDAEGIVADILSAAGQQIRFSAERGWIDREIGLMGLTGGVTIEAEPGYRLEAAQVTASLDQMQAEASGGVSGSAPAGRLRSDRATLSPSAFDPRSHVLVFTGDVRLLYRAVEAEGE
jgi:lipopolysaccharide export system protein LptC